MERINKWKTKTDRRNERMDLLTQRQKNQRVKVTHILRIKENQNIPITDTEKLQQELLKQNEDDTGKLLTKRSIRDGVKDHYETNLFNNLLLLADNETASEIHTELMKYLSKEQIQLANRNFGDIEHKANKIFKRGSSSRRII